MVTVTVAVNFRIAVADLVGEALRGTGAVGKLAEGNSSEVEPGHS